MIQFRAESSSGEIKTVLITLWVCSLAIIVLGQQGGTEPKVRFCLSLHLHPMLTLTDVDLNTILKAAGKMLQLQASQSR